MLEGERAAQQVAADTAKVDSRMAAVTSCLLAALRAEAGAIDAAQEALEKRLAQHQACSAPAHSCQSPHSHACSARSPSAACTVLLRANWLQRLNVQQRQAALDPGAEYVGMCMRRPRC